MLTAEYSRKVSAGLMLGLGLLEENQHGEVRIAALLLVSFVAAVFVAEKFYIVFDATLHGCTIMTAEPTDKIQHKILGKNQSKAEAEKAIASMKC